MDVSQILGELRKKVGSEVSQELESSIAILHPVPKINKYIPQSHQFRAREMQVEPYGLTYRLPEDPVAVSPVFQCPNCSAECYDGGIPRKLKCLCGQLPEALSIDSFEDAFYTRCQKPESTEIQVLETITFGVFEETLPEEYRTGEDVNFYAVLNNFLVPWLLSSQRCLGINDLFQYQEVKFKVIATHVSYGFVTSFTFIQCFKLLQQVPLRQVTIAFLEPSVPDSAAFDSVLQPYIQRYQRHIHSGDLHLDQYIYVQGIECTVSECEPENGIVTSDTLIIMENRRLDAIFVMKLNPFEDEVSEELQALEPIVLREYLLTGLIKPFFAGWRRAVPQNREFVIQGITFRTTFANSRFGYAGPLTRIEFDGSFCTRNRFDNSDFLRMLGQSQDQPELDPFAQLMRQLQGMRRPNGEEDGKRLPVQKLEKLSENSDFKSCTICMEDFQLGEEVKRLPCCKCLRQFTYFMWVALMAG